MEASIWHMLHTCAWFLSLLFNGKLTPEQSYEKQSRELLLQVLNSSTYLKIKIRVLAM